MLLETQRTSPAIFVGYDASGDGEDVPSDGAVQEEFANDSQIRLPLGP
ncbi:MAG TPA: hypothetical protein VGK34_03870 [Armatimonadota bacterium]